MRYDDLSRKLGEEGGSETRVLENGMRLRQTFPPLTTERGEFLRNRAKPFIEKEPRLVELRQRLLDVGGHEVVLAEPVPHANDLIERGRVFPTARLRIRRGEPNRCHSNTAELWYGSNGQIKIATGFGLSNDGLWRLHSWGVEGGRIVETTSGHWLCYYGIELADEEALKFMFAYASPDLMERFGRDLATGALFPELVETARAVVEGDRLQ